MKRSWEGRKVLYEIETQRTGISARSFFTHCDKFAKSHGLPEGLSAWVDSFDSWEEPFCECDLRDKHSDWEEPLYEICCIKPCEYQLYLEGAYNFILEWFDNVGYMYIVEFER